MTILEKVVDTFKECKIGMEFTRREIIKMVSKKHGVSESSIIPSDYCYNRTNMGIEFDRYVHIFEFLGNGMYKYLGENYPYSGLIISKPQGGLEEVVGEWVEGKYKFNIS